MIISKDRHFSECVSIHAPLVSGSTMMWGFFQSFIRTNNWFIGDRTHNNVDVTTIPHYFLTRHSIRRFVTLCISHSPWHEPNIGDLPHDEFVVKLNDTASKALDIGIENMYNINVHWISQLKSFENMAGVQWKYTSIIHQERLLEIAKTLGDILYRCPVRWSTGDWKTYHYQKDARLVIDNVQHLLTDPIVDLVNLTRPPGFDEYEWYCSFFTNYLLANTVLTDHHHKMKHDESLLHDDILQEVNKFYETELKFFGYKA